MVRWGDVSRDAEGIFRVWTDARELDWAKKSWASLVKRGLTSYADEVGRTRVMVRLMALAAMYRDFCELAFDEVHDPAYPLWADELCLSTFRVAQCVGSQFGADEGRDDQCLLEEALVELMEEARSQIHMALREEFGDDSLLFVSLWNTVEYWRDGDDGETEPKRAGTERQSECKNGPKENAEIDWLDDAGWILNNDLTGQKLAAHNWIVEGMRSLHLCSFWTSHLCD
jgi:hypothetical protein